MCELLLQSLGDKCLAALEARAHARAQTNTATSANKALPMARSVIEVRTSLTSMFERYLDEHVIQTKLQPLEAASALLSCAPESWKLLSKHGWILGGQATIRASSPLPMSCRRWQ